MRYPPREWLPQDIEYFTTVKGVLAEQPTAIILHPDPLVRNQFGCLHASEMYFYLLLATAYLEGWHDCNAAQPRWQRHAGYADVRGMLRGFCDLPELWAEQVAMYATRDMRDMPYMEFRPLL